ncbi:MAG: FxsA family protein [Pseudomonadota bacterium]
MKLLLITLILLPFIEIAVAIQVGGSIGALNTILLMIVSAILGIYFVRQQGIQTLTNFQRNAQLGRLELGSLLSGVLLAIAGLALIIPGFITDGFGLLLLFPPIRKIILLLFVRFSANNLHFRSANSQNANSFNTVEGHYEDITESKSKAHLSNSEKVDKS